MAYFVSLVVGVAKNNRLGHSANLVEFGSDVFCHKYVAVFDFDLLAKLRTLKRFFGFKGNIVEVGFVLFGLVACFVYADIDFCGHIRGKETVSNTVFERICKHRLTKVGYVVVFNVFVLARCGCETELCGSGEIFQNLVPFAVGFAAASVTFVDDDKVEEVFGVLGVRLFVVVVDS